MHLEKNVFKSMIGILLDIKEKTKDGLKSWMDLVNLVIRHDIHLQPSTQNEKVYNTLGVELTHLHLDCIA
jgi:hypothetical protein